MKYFLCIMLVLSLFSLRSAHAGVYSCNATLINCLSDDLTWCAYDGDCLWDTLYASTDGTLTAGESSGIVCNSLEDVTECYVAGNASAIDINCVSVDVDGFVDCNDYACVDGDVSWHSGSSEYCCSDNACTTDCD